MTKHPRSAFLTTLATRAGGSGESISSVVSAPTIDALTLSSSTEPVTPTLVENLTREAVLSKGWSFAGTTRLPLFRCEGGFLGPVLGLVLSALVSGPENAYSLQFGPPGG